MSVLEFANWITISHPPRICGIILTLLIGLSGLWIYPSNAAKELGRRCKYKSGNRSRGETVTGVKNKLFALLKSQFVHISFASDCGMARKWPKERSKVKNNGHYEFFLRSWVVDLAKK